MTAARKSLRMLLLTLAAYGLLVVTNEGEFWPFSIYPMFSQGGKPWSRAIVRDIDASTVAWDTVAADGLPGQPFPLLQHGVDPIDLANFVSKTKVWDEARVGGLRRMFGDVEDGRNLLVVRANGGLASSDSVVLVFVPYAVVSASGVVLNPVLPRTGDESYRSLR